MRRPPGKDWQTRKRWSGSPVTAEPISVTIMSGAEKKRSAFSNRDEIKFHSMEKTI
jgi:hypothetical protein